jgi:hypothetical protein
MPKRRRRSRPRLRTRGDEFFGLLGGLVAGYFVAEGALQRSMHPLHWVASLVVGALGYAGVWLWDYWRRAYREERTRQAR